MNTMNIVYIEYNSNKQNSQSQINAPIKPQADYKSENNPSIFGQAKNF